MAGRIEDNENLIKQVDNIYIDPASSFSSKDVSPTDMDSARWRDSLYLGLITPQKFNDNEPATYAFDPKHPQLPQPVDNPGPDPFSPQWQAETHKYFKDQVKVLILKELGLKPGDDIPDKVDARVSKIFKALASGQAESLSAKDKAIASAATAETQAAWSLPASWVVGSKEKLDWTPVKEVVTPPAGIDLRELNKAYLSENIDEVLDAVDQAIKTTGDWVKENFPDNAPYLLDMLKMVSDALRGLKQILREVQMAENEITTRVSQGKISEINLQSLINEATQKITEELMLKQEEARKSADTIKIVSLVVSALVLAVSVLAIPFTGGSSVAIAAAIVGAFMMAYTVTDTCTGCTEKMVNAINKALEGIEEPWQTVTKAIIIVTLITIIAVASVYSGGGAAVAATSQIALQVAKSATLQLIMQFTIMMLIASNLIPEFVIDNIKKSGTKLDQDAEMAVKIAVMVVLLMGILIGTTVGVRGAASSISNAAKGAYQMATNLSATLQDLKEAITSGLRMAAQQILDLIKACMDMLISLKNSLQDLVKSVGSAASQVSATITDNLKRVMEMATQLKNYLTSPQFTQDVKNIAAAAVEAAKNAPGTIKDAVLNAPGAAVHASRVALDNAIALCHRIVERLGNMLEAIKEASLAAGRHMKETFNYYFVYKPEMAEDMQQKMALVTSRMKMALEEAKLGTDIAYGIMNGLQGVEMAKLIKEGGLTKEAKERLEALIKVFENLFNMMTQDVVNVEEEMIKSLDKALEALYSSQTEVFTRASQKM